MVAKDKIYEGLAVITSNCAKKINIGKKDHHWGIKSGVIGDMC